MKIIYKLIIGFMAVILLIWAVGYFAVNSSQKALQKSIIDNSVLLSEKIWKTVEAELGVTISLGISTSYQGTEEEDELINKADHALYQAKQKGKNRVEVSA